MNKNYVRLSDRARFRPDAAVVEVSGADRPGLLALDTGCVWGGCLTAARLGDGGSSVELISVRCEQAARPGKG